MISQKQKTVVILSVSSDIGCYLANYYLDQGYAVIGSYRQKAHVADLVKRRQCHLFPCDLNRPQSIQQFLKSVKNLNQRWDVFISCVGYLLPSMPFFASDFNEWRASVSVNCIEQLHVLHGLYPFHQPKGAHAVFFAGGGMNNPVKDLSAYTASKIFLTKMCEFLDMEEKHLSVFIVGPGWTKTKIHQALMKDPRTAKHKITETQEFLTAKQGTSLKDIAACIDWLCQQKKTIVSGRNFSVVHDPWRPNTRACLVRALKSDEGMYKLRRQGNNFHS